MADPTYIACPRCGEPYAMTAMQKRLYHGRTVTCQRCAKPFTVSEQTPDPVPAGQLPGLAAIAAGAALSAATSGIESPLPTPGSVLPSRIVEGDKTSGGLTAGRLTVLIVLVAAVIGGLLYFAVAPSLHRSREANRRATCASNLTQIGVALQFYASANRGAFPDNLAVLVADGTLAAELLVCPSSDETPITGNMTAEELAGLAAGEHQSFVYLGSGMNTGQAKQIVVYEPLDHHDGKGVNVLYSDGTTAFLLRSAALTALPQLSPPGDGSRVAQPTSQSSSVP